MYLTSRLYYLFSALYFNSFSFLFKQFLCILVKNSLLSFVTITFAHCLHHYLSKIPSSILSDPDGDSFYIMLYFTLIFSLLIFLSYLAICLIVIIDILSSILFGQLFFLQTSPLDSLLLFSPHEGL
jgi:hypothetical protein